MVSRLEVWRAEPLHLLARDGTIGYTVCENPSGACLATVCSASDRDLIIARVPSRASNRGCHLYSGMEERTYFDNEYISFNM